MCCLQCHGHEWHAELRRALHWLSRGALQWQAQSKGNIFLPVNHKEAETLQQQNNTLKKKQDLSCCCSTKTMQPLPKTAVSIHWVGQKISSLFFSSFFFFFSCMQLFHFNKVHSLCLSKHPAQPSTLACAAFLSPPSTASCSLYTD